MKQCLFLSLAGLALVQPVRAQELSAEEIKEGFVSLFNGKDFSGWRFGPGSALGPLPKNWKVAEGMIRLLGGGSPHLASQWDYEDFDIRIQWRAKKKGYNSGFYIRSGRNVGPNQINLAQRDAGHLMGGAKGGKAVPDLQKEPGQWNDWRVLARGDKLTFWCNGKRAWEVTGFKPARGYIGLQAEGAAIDFKNLRIKEIGYQPVTNLEFWNGKGWQQQDDVLVAGPDSAPLRSKRQDFRNFVLRLEWKASAEGKGPRLRLGPKGNVMVDLGPKAPVNPAGQWNYWEVRCLDGKITGWLNGTSTFIPKELPPAGPIVLEPAGGIILRNLRIRENRAGD